jgi:hypothetical protein
MDGQLDAVDLLSATAPHLVPQRVVEVASTMAGCPVAAYVLNLEGLFALRLAGDVERFPARIRTPIGVGPEVIPGSSAATARSGGRSRRALHAVAAVGRARVMGFCWRAIGRRMI